MEAETLERIKSRGHWYIVMTPNVFNKSKLGISECRQTVEECQVKLRGWYYPHIGNRHGELFSGNDYFEGLVDWQDHKEVWRMYTSGQFVHYLAMVEDWWSETRGLFGEELPQQNRIEPGTKKEVDLTLFNVTEIFAFASRLASRGVFDLGFHLSLTLNGVMNRTLFYWEPGRHLNGPYTAGIESISVSGDYSTEQILSDHRNAAVRATAAILQRFNWHSEQLEDILRRQQAELSGVQGTGTQ